MPRRRRLSSTPPGYKPPVLPQSDPASRFGVRIRPPTPNYDGGVDPAYPDSGDERPAKPTGAKKLSDDEFQSLVRTAIDNARDYDEDQIKPSRLKAWKFFDGMVDLPVNEGGSSVVSYDVRDAVAAIMPSMMRVFMASDEIGEFEPKSASEADWAPLATTYVSQLIRTKLGAIQLRGAIQDAFMSRVGCVKWWWEEGKRVTTQRYVGLDATAFAQATDPEDEKTEVDIVEREDYSRKPSAEEMAAYQIAIANAQAMQQQPPPPPAPLPLIDCTVRYTRTSKMLRMAAVPPEERLIDPNARTPETARVRGHRRVLKVWELVDMGYDRDLCVENATVEESDDNDEDKANRMPEGVTESDADLPGDDNRDVEYCEVWLHADRDGDGVAELLKVCTLGNAFHIVDEEEADQIRMAEFQAIPRPHTATGDSLADNLLDIQRMKTALLRGLMESLPHTIYPRYIGVEGKVNWDDLLSTLPGQPIRVKGDAQSAVQPLRVEFVGQAAVEVSQWIDSDIKEPRIGVSKAAMGLDPDALQSTPAVAAGAMVSASQSQLEDFARCLAETGWRELMLGILREVVTHQHDPGFAKLNGKWMPVDPRPWNADLTFGVDPAIGSGDNAKKILVMQGIAGAQVAAMEKLGPQNPLVTLKQVYNAQRRIAQLGGVPNPDAYWSDPGSAQAPTPPGQGDNGAAAQAAELAKAEVEKAKITDATNRWKIKLEDDRDRDKQEMDFVLEAMKLSFESGQTIDPGPIIAMMRQGRPNDPMDTPPPNPALTAPAQAG